MLFLGASSYDRIPATPRLKILTYFFPSNSFDTNTKDCRRVATILRFQGAKPKGNEWTWRGMCNCPPVDASHGSNRGGRDRTHAQCHYELAITEEETTMVPLPGRGLSELEGIFVGTILA